jgi:ribosome-binding protein aMBF1 (putative translation factor)
VFVFNTIVCVISLVKPLAFIKRRSGGMSKKTAKKKKEVLREFANKVRNRRYVLGITQEQLAERGDFHVNYIGGIERGERNPSFESIIYLAKALECSPKELMPE